MLQIKDKIMGTLMMLDILSNILYFMKCSWTLNMRQTDLSSFFFIENFVARAIKGQTTNRIKGKILLITQYHVV